MSPGFPFIQKVLVTALLSGTRLRSMLAAVPAFTPMQYSFHASRATLSLRGLPLPLKQCGLRTAWGTAIRPWLDVLCLALQVGKRRPGKRLPCSCCLPSLFCLLTRLPSHLRVCVWGGGVRIVGPPSADHLEMQLPCN